MNSERFLFNSDYPMDKIVWLKEGELTTNEWGGWQDVSIPHDVGAQIFVKGVFSHDNWNTVYPVGIIKYDEMQTEVMGQAEANSSRILFSGFTPIAHQTKVKYRFWALLNEGESKGVLANPTVGQSANRVMLDGSLEYPMLVQEGYINPGERVKHNLGKIPFADIWATFNGSDWHIHSDDYISKDGYNMGNYIQLTNNEIIATNNTGTPSKFYYRIYL